MESREACQGELQLDRDEAPWLKSALCLAVLFCVTVAAFLPALRSPFVRDDFLAIIYNHAGRTSGSLGEVLFSSSYHATRPLFNLVNAVEIRLFGPHPMPFHLVDLSVHLVNGLLAWILIGKLAFVFSKGRPYVCRSVCWCACGIFLLHPLQVESVVHISAGSGLFMVAFYLFALILFASYKRLSMEAGNERGGRASRLALYMASLACSVVAVFFKESAATILFSVWGVNILFEVLYNTRCGGSPTRQHLFGPAIPFVLPLLIVPAMLVTLPYRHVTIGSDVVDPWLHFVTQGKVILLFIAKFVLPLGLNFDYDLPLARSVFAPLPVAGYVFLALVTFLSWRLRKPYPLFLAGWLFFLATLSPTNSVVPNKEFMAERHLYLSLLGLAMGVAGFLANVKGRRAFAIASLVIVYLVPFTIQRAHVWSDDSLLYLDTMKKSPGLARAPLNLAAALMRAGRFEEAVEVYDAVLQETPWLARVPQGDMERETLSKRFLEIGIAKTVQGEDEAALRLFALSRKVWENQEAGLLQEMVRERSGRVSPQFPPGVKHYTIPLLSSAETLYAVARLQASFGNDAAACRFLEQACGIYYPVACEEHEESCLGAPGDGDVEVEPPPG